MLTSIIITNFNREKFLDRCIRSCLDQIVFNKEIEIIFVDDGSKDNSLKTISKYKDRIKIYSLKKNMGISYASNYAIKKSKGEYIIRVDSDDFLNRHAIEMMSSILENNTDFSFVCCDHYRVDEIGMKEKIVRLNNKSVIKNHGAGVLFRKSVLKKVGYYNTKLIQAEDYEMISKIMNISKYYYLPVPLYRYYIHGDNISVKGNRKNIIKSIGKI